MKAAVLVKYNENLIYEDVPKPEISERDDVIIKMVGAGICRTDLHEKMGEFGHKLKLPLIMGHENIGFIDDIGDNTMGLTKGLPVIMFPYVTNGYCLNCRKGNDMFCTEKPYILISLLLPPRYLFKRFKDVFLLSCSFQFAHTSTGIHRHMVRGHIAVPNNER